MSASAAERLVARYAYGVLNEMTEAEVKEDLANKGFDFKRRIHATFEPDESEVIYTQDPPTQ